MVDVQVIVAVVSISFLIGVGGVMAYFAFMGPSPDYESVSESDNDPSMAD